MSTRRTSRLSGVVAKTYGHNGLPHDTIQVSLREKEGTKVYFLLNHQNSQVRIQFYKPMHDFLTGKNFSGNYDMPPFGVLVLDEHPELKAAEVEAAVEAEEAAG